MSTNATNAGGYRFSPRTLCGSRISSAFTRAARRYVHCSGAFRAFLTSTLHYVMNPIIEVDGNRATGNWLLLEPCTFVQDNQRAWGAGRYEEQFLKVGGEWKLKRLKLVSSFWNPHEQGWVKRRF